MAVLSRHSLLALLLCATGPALYAQDDGCYTSPDFEVWVEKDIPYGQAATYCGQNQNLLMDLYRPIGDGNPARPAVVLIHGGAFLGGDKGSPDMAETARAFAARGYVAASINYRLGFHKSVFYANEATNCALLGALAGIPSPQCLYAYDKEIRRALYRGIQDARGAIRFVKNQIDSVDAANVFVGGGSAGGFIALGVGYMDDEEAPEEAGAQPAIFGGIPIAYWGCHANGAQCSLQRPALGPVQGELNTGNHDASVKGVLNIFGGLLDLNWIDEGEPALYAYHQDNDLVSPCASGKPFAAVLPQCGLNACAAIPNTWPESFGSCAMQEYLDTLAGAPEHEIWIDECPLPSFPCNYSCHEVNISTINQIVDNTAHFWSSLICPPVQTEEAGQAAEPGIRLLPNPAREELRLIGPDGQGPWNVAVFNLAGQCVLRTQLRNRESLDVSGLRAGFYFVKMDDGENSVVLKVVVGG